MSADPPKVISRFLPEPDQVISYGEGPDRVVDLFWATGPPTGTLVVLVHGGFWRAGFDRTHTRAASAGLTAAGHVVAAIEYHRVGQPDGGWPGTLDDVAAAVDAVPELVAPLPRGSGLTRTVLLGHSAGGHLVTWAASRPSLPTSSPWHRPDAGADAAVSLGGVVDLALAHRLGLGDGAVAGLLGGGPGEVPERFALADPAVLTPACRVLLVHGMDDDIVPIAVARAYHAAVSARGADSHMVGQEDTDHFGVIDPLSSAWPSVLEAVGSGRR